MGMNNTTYNKTYWSRLINRLRRGEEVRITEHMMLHASSYYD